MKLKLSIHHWLLPTVCLTCLPTSALLAGPQENDITITAVVTADDQGDKDKSKGDAAKDEGEDGPKKRNAIRLRFNQGPVVLMRRAALDNDDSAKADQSKDGNENAEATPPTIWLGIGLKEIEGDLATYLGSSQGVFIESIFPDSPAEVAKLQAGDIVIEFQGHKVSGPAALVESLRAVKAVEQEKDVASLVTYPDVTMTILRRGQEMKVELKPRQRPTNLKIARVSERDDLTEGANIFEFGQPGEATLNLVKPFGKTISNIVVVVKEDGKEYIARVERNGDEPAKIIVTEGKEERQLREDQLDQLPEKVREAIKNALKAKHNLQFKSSDKNDGDDAKAKEQALDEIQEQLEKAMKQVGGGKIDIELKDLAESLKGAGKGRVIIVDPDKLQDVRKMTEDAKSMAKKWAEAGAEQARGFANMPEQLKDLKQQVDDLKKQVEELREELKASKK